jgi:exopolyphosphatase/guanosine-5'-triphosphate,3'-diphosphate pyrophosphatase
VVCGRHFAVAPRAGVASLDERLKMPGLDPRRADLAAVGAVLLDELLRRLKADDLMLCDYALREGLILDYIKRNIGHIRTAERYPDVRRRSVIELGERCAYLPDHAQQVARLSLALFDATRVRHGLGAREREWLEYGSLLHDIGTHISYDAHHKHSYYLICHGGLRGFDPLEVEIIGLIARYHRQAAPRKSHEGYSGLSRPHRRAVKWLSAMLRLAEGLDRSHGQLIRDLRLRTGPKGVRIALRTAPDAELELWAAGRHATALSRMLEAPIRFEALPAPGRRRHRPPRAVRPPRRSRGL